MKRFRPVIIWAAVTVVLIAAALWIPRPWVQKVEKTFKVKERPSAFAQSTIDAEAEFDHAPTFKLTTESRELLTLIAIRKLLRQGKLNHEEMDRAHAKLVVAFDRVRNSTDGGEAARRDLELELIKVLPRLTPEQIREVTRSLWAKLEIGTIPAKSECSDCHTQVRALPSQLKFDAIGHYPGIRPNAFRFGSAIPVLTETYEIQSAVRLEREPPQQTACLDCHASHESANFRVDLDRRKDNLGFWMNLDSDPIPGMVDVEIKLKTFGSAHRAPAGFPSRAYVVTVAASSEGTPLELWFGNKLPAQVSTKPGVAFVRWMRDADGNLTGDPAKAVAFDDDTRLQHNRFSSDHFVFIEPSDGGEVEVTATLHYLPNFPTWDGAEEVFELEKER